MGGELAIEKRSFKALPLRVLEVVRPKTRLGRRNHSYSLGSQILTNIVITAIANYFTVSAVKK